MKKISIVVPMYNEEEMLPIFFEHISAIIDNNKLFNFEIVAVNDGSRDETLNLLLEKQREMKNLVVVNLTRNWGHESAVFAGLQVASGDAVIPIDADLQDPPEIIPQMIEMWENGYQVVNAQRSSREKDTEFKKNTAGIYYRLLNNMSDKVKIPYNVANFRLIDREVLNQLLKLKENNRVLRIEIPFLGYKTGTVLFAREERIRGKSKYNLPAMVRLAFHSLVSLTTRPLYLTSYFAIVAILTFLVSGLTELVLFILTTCNVMYIPELWFATWLVINIMLFISIFVLISLAIMSSYQSEVVTQSRKRPEVIIEKVYKNE